MPPLVAAALQHDLERGEIAVVRGVVQRAVAHLVEARGGGDLVRVRVRVRVRFRVRARARARARVRVRVRVTFDVLNSATRLSRLLGETLLEEDDEPCLVVMDGA